MSQGVHERRDQNIRVNGKKICLNPSCWEEIPENRVYCCPECSNACKYLREAKRKGNALLKYHEEYKVGSPRKNTLGYAVRVSVQGKHPPDFDY